ncbi:MAG: hypothetical protein ACRDRH_13335 [Pseudonocardia sp.]
MRSQGFAAGVGVEQRVEQRRSPFVGDSEMATRMRGVGWAAAALGPVQGSPPSLRVAVGIMLCVDLLSA